MTFLLSDDVAMAIAAGRAVVGLETSVIGQGLPFPRNLECVERMEAAIRRTGATPGSPSRVRRSRWRGATSRSRWHMAHSARRR